MNLFHKKSKFKEVLKRALACYQAGDNELCRQALQDFLSITTIRKIRKFRPDNFDQGNTIFEMLWRLDFDNYPEGSTQKILYLTVFLYLIENAPSEIKEELNREFEKVLSIEPVGYTDNGEPCFKVEDMAMLFGVSKTRVIEILEKTGGLIEDEIHLIN